MESPNGCEQNRQQSSIKTLSKVLHGQTMLDCHAAGLNFLVFIPTNTLITTTDKLNENGLGKNPSCNSAGLKRTDNARNKQEKTRENKI